ncbi:histidine phosphatase family protein [Phenylobacterium terrae]|uniref:Histidine phosphatase family protein n=1 Tax=Phenylobacterium terrae TaxID=2665495 RepID=A0ABW4MWG5_9CAUL
MTTVVYFVRHGSHDRLGKVLCGRMPGVTLSEQGLAECEALARRLAREPIDAVYASPLERTVATGEPIAQALGLPLQLSENLLEVDYGDWTGARFEELDGRAEWRTWNEERASALPPGGESMAQVQMRVGRFINEAVQGHPDQRVVAVTHGDVIKAALMAGLSLSLNEHHRIEVSPGSLSVVVAGEWGLKVHSMNEVPA